MMRVVWIHRLASTTVEELPKLSLGAEQFAVAARFGALGYDHDAAATKALRDAVKDIAWLRDTILVLRRRAP